MDLEGLRSLTLKGKEGAEQIQGILASFRAESITNLGGLQIATSEDYQTGIRVTSKGEEKIDLPKSNVLKYTLTDGSWICLRPSGTEPKVKFYFGVNSESLEKSKRKLQELEKNFMELVDEKVKMVEGK